MYEYHLVCVAVLLDSYTQNPKEFDFLTHKSDLECAAHKTRERGHNIKCQLGGGNGEDGSIWVPLPFTNYYTTMCIITQYILRVNRSDVSCSVKLRALDSTLYKLTTECRIIIYCLVHAMGLLEGMGGAGYSILMAIIYHTAESAHPVPKPATHTHTIGLDGRKKGFGLINLSI